jgi:hypothetical protein
MPAAKAVIPGRELQLAGPESITHVPAKAGNRFRIMDSGLAARSQVYAGCVNMMLRRPGMTAVEFGLGFLWPATGLPALTVL